MTQRINVKKAMGWTLIESFIDPTATLGEGSVAWDYSRIFHGARIGKHCNIGGGTEIGRSCIIGDYARIGANCFIPNRTIIGERVFIGPMVTLCDDRHPRTRLPGDPPYEAEPPIIEDDAVIGAGVVILPGVTVGKHARVGAGAIVTRDVPPFTHVRCEPARMQALSPESEESWRSPLSGETL
jgi:UDP-2-acetamido-3-amino-2,3-dideoxy-glucuronate N-acetyltransferase